jgi:hypothetical protein
MTNGQKSQHFEWSLAGRTMSHVIVGAVFVAIATPPSAAQSVLPDSKSSIDSMGSTPPRPQEAWLSSAALRRAVGQPAILAQASDPLSDWRGVMRLDVGQPLLISARGVALAERYLVAVDDRRLVLLDLTDPTLAAGDRSWLVGLTQRSTPALLDALNGMDVRRDGMRLSRDGVYRDDRRVGDLTRWLSEISRADVVAVSRPAERSGSGLRTATTAVYALCGFGLGFFGASTVAFRPCGATCDDERAIIYGSLIGGPAAMGFIGWRRSGPRGVTTIYRRP